MTKKESIFILFSITLCWSSSYIFIKDIPQSFSVYAYLALTSGVAGIILALVMRRKLRLLNKVSLRQGLILGALITMSNMFEKLGLDHIPASSASVYASMGIIIVPLILLFKKEYPTRNNLAGIAVILIGIFVSNWGTMGGAGLVGALYILASATSFIIDLVLFAVLCRLLRGKVRGYVVIATVIARVISAVYNYLVNYKVVFESDASHRASGAKYLALAVAQMAVSAALVTGVTSLISVAAEAGGPALPPAGSEVAVKAVVDSILFFVSYKLQQKYVFGRG